jgi:thioredoxin-like negative regulator of GroEL
MANEYTTFSTDNKGMFRIGAVDCEDQPKICEKEKISNYPTMKIYPPFPAPAFDVEINDKFDSKVIRARAGRFINDRSIEITHNNHKAFVNEDIATPKVMLFTNSKKGTPFIYKALSQQFEKTLQFGLVRDTEEGLAKQYKIKSYPTMYVIKDGKPIKYEEKEFTYTKLFEFINVYS